MSLGVRLMFWVLVSALTVPSICAADPVMWDGNGHWYDLVAEELTWTAARDSAAAATWMSVSGYLASATSQEEYDFLAAEFLVGQRARIWLGGYQNPTSSPPNENWHWVNGDLWSYTNWTSGEPNDYWGPGSESCLQWRIEWIDAQCHETEYFIVEFEPETPVVPTGWGPIKALYRGTRE